MSGGLLFVGFIAAYIFLCALALICVRLARTCHACGSFIGWNGVDHSPDPNCSNCNGSGEYYVNDRDLLEWTRPCNCSCAICLSCLEAEKYLRRSSSEVAGL